MENKRKIVKKELFGIRLKNLMTDRSETIYTIAELTGLSAATISRYTTGELPPKKPTIEMLSRYFNVNPAWLMGYDVDRYLVIKNDEISTKRIPLIGHIAAGQPITAVEHIEDWIIVDERDDVDFALRVNGDSMTNVGIYDGDIIYIRKQPTVNNGEIAVVLIDDGFPDTTEATCKRFYQYGKTIVLRPESHNPIHKEQEYILGKGQNISVLGKVIFLKSYVEGR